MPIRATKTSGGRGGWSLRQLLDRWPGKQTFGTFRFLPGFFLLGAALEFTMIKWTVGETNFCESDSQCPAWFFLVCKSRIKASQFYTSKSNLVLHTFPILFCRQDLQEATSEQRAGVRGVSQGSPSSHAKKRTKVALIRIVRKTFYAIL